MLLSRQELAFDFKGAKFDLNQADDRALLGWIFNQFLYGEVTGIQCGHWLYHAPHLNAASFLARQATEELSHVKRVLRILTLLRQNPGPPHGVVRFLSTGMMGGSWGEHVTLEMALGEGLVLGVFYGLADTIDDPEIHKILESALVEEERHVEFGERETASWLRMYPEDRKLLLGLAVLQAASLRGIKRFILKRMLSSGRSSHPVMKNFERFYDHTLKCFERRIERLGLSDMPLSRMGNIWKLLLVFCLPGRKLRAIVRRRLRGRRLLTDTYLNDPWIVAERGYERESQGE